MRLRAKQEKNQQKKGRRNQLAFGLLCVFSVVRIFVDQAKFDKYYQEAGLSLDLPQGPNRSEWTISSIDDSSIDDSNSSNSTKPMLILHVGPMKTGTTAIQLGVLTKKNILKALKEDNISNELPYINYVVMGNLHTKCLDKPINDTHCQHQQSWDDFYEKLVTTRSVSYTHLTLPTKA